MTWNEKMEESEASSSLEEVVGFYGSGTLQDREQNKETVFKPEDMLDHFTSVLYREKIINTWINYTMTRLFLMSIGFERLALTLKKNTTNDSIQQASSSWFYYSSVNGLFPFPGHENPVKLASLRHLSLSGSFNSDDFDSDMFDSEHDASERETEDINDDDDGKQVDGEEDGSDEGSDHEQDEVVEESDSSEDEVPPINTVGNALKWYKDEKHIGYDTTGKKITKKRKRDRLDSLLVDKDDSRNCLKIYDEYNDEEVEVTKEEIYPIRRILKAAAPHADFDPCPPYVDWFKWHDAKHPLSSAPEPKRRRIRSKWEAKIIVKIVRAIRKGWIKFGKPEEEPKLYLLWHNDDSTSDQKSKQLIYTPPPKQKLPGHEESYNPSLEYIPTEKDIALSKLMCDTTGK
ncbi:PREDICTED: ribosome biogenesis protein BOP1 homolog [Camelina sativa]|uniref:Ribosome biogenesis protein BOP1 homolog n=1 Tax=Camelina sativa TaxID=90675 RepID=A0ABM0WHI1_CAMSA|nr:PREDICTED: ribosome biogenesis protein BOP1 homolog [Camelina sativa]